MKNEKQRGGLTLLIPEVNNRSESLLATMQAMMMITKKK